MNLDQICTINLLINYPKLNGINKTQLLRIGKPMLKNHQNKNNIKKMKPQTFKNGQIKIDNRIIGNWETYDHYRDAGDNYSLLITFNDLSIFKHYCTSTELDLFYEIIRCGYYDCDFTTGEKIDFEIGYENALGTMTFTLNASELREELRNYNLQQLIQ